MANEQKDRLGDKLRDLEHAREEKFFAERDKEALARLRAKQSAAPPAPCPTCGEALEQKDGTSRCRNGHRVG